MSSISGVAFFDSKGDGSHDVMTGAEISDTFVSLFACSNEIIDTTNTDTMGYYTFDKLYEGRYYIIAMAPQWFAFSDMWNGKTDENTGELVNSELDSAVNPSTGSTECFDLEQNESKTVSFGLKLAISSNSAQTKSAPSSAPMTVVAMRSPSASPSKFAKSSTLEPSISKTPHSQFPPSSYILSPPNNFTILDASSSSFITLHKPSQSPTSSFHPTTMPSTLPDAYALPGGAQKLPHDLDEKSDNLEENGNSMIYIAIAVCIGVILVAALILLTLRKREKRREESMEPCGTNDPSCCTCWIDGDLETGLQSSFVPASADRDCPLRVRFGSSAQFNRFSSQAGGRDFTSRFSTYSIADIPEVTSFEVVKIHVIAPAGKLGIVTEKPATGGPGFVCYIKDTSPISDKVNLEDEIIAVDGKSIRNMTGDNLSELLASKSEQVERRITLLREIGPNGAFETEQMGRSPSCRLGLDSIANIPEVVSLNIAKIHLIAPAGKLGIATETRRGGGSAFVCKIKDACPVVGKIQLEDGIIAIDDEDIRNLTAVALNKLLASKIDQVERKITVLRRAVGHCEYRVGNGRGDNGDSSSNSSSLSLEGINITGDSSPQQVLASEVETGGETEEEFLDCLCDVEVGGIG